MKNASLTIAISSLIALTAIASAKPTLYDRVGGIHKIAAAVDMSMAQQANDELLNENPRFKQAVTMGLPIARFAITNTLASLAGGPQKLGFDATPIEKWVAFTPAQNERCGMYAWQAFEKLGVAKADFEELMARYDKRLKMAKPMAPMQEPFMKADSLYARLGGIAPLSMVVNDFIDQLATDPTITANPHVVKSITSGKISAAGLKYLVTEQLAAASGGPFKYSGRDMKSSHTGLMISENEWKAGAGILKRVLDAYKVPEKEQGEIFAVIASTHGDIVGR